jgi:regulatory protein
MSRGRDALPREDSYVQAVERATRLLAHRSRSRQEVRDRLLSAGFQNETVDRVEARLAEFGILNDAALARNWIEGSAIPRGMARAAIQNQLRARGVDPHMVEETVNEVMRETDETELERAVRIAKRRARAYGHLARGVAWRRLAGFLANRGYDEEVVAGACREVLGEPD